MAKDRTLTVNPFLEENFAHQGGLWDGKVTFLRVSAKSGFLGRDDAPFLNEKGEKVVQNYISVLGIADTNEFEREERYSVGGTLIPTEDGEGFVDINTKKPKKFSPGSNAAKFALALAAAGFDVNLLWDEKELRTKLSKLNGAVFEMKGEPRKDKNGKDKVDNKGFTSLAFFPVKFLGFKAGVAAPQPASNELKEKATRILGDAIVAAGGTLTRIAAIKAIQATGDPDVNKIIALIGTQDFHKGQAWKVDASGYSL